MADMREKLIELVGQVQDCGCDVTDVVEMIHVENDVLVDHLIANGVTLDNQVSSSKWIPVTERLPERNKDGTLNAVLVTDGVIQHMAYFAKDEFYFTENGEMKEPMFYNVTHWMPLPEPPKGE